MVIISTFCTDKMLFDVKNDVTNFGKSITSLSGKDLRIRIEDDDVDSLALSMECLTKYGVSYQVDSDDELTDLQKEILGQY